MTPPASAVHLRELIQLCRQAFHEPDHATHGQALRMPEDLAIDKDEFMVCLLEALEEDSGVYAQLDLDEFRRFADLVLIAGWLGDTATAEALLFIGERLDLWAVARPRTPGGQTMCFPVLYDEVWSVIS